MCDGSGLFAWCAPTTGRTARSHGQNTGRASLHVYPIGRLSEEIEFSPQTNELDTGATASAVSSCARATAFGPGPLGARAEALPGGYRMPLSEALVPLH